MHINGDAWAAAFLASEPEYGEPAWLDAYAMAFGRCRPDLTPAQAVEAAKVAAGLDAVFGPAR